MGYKDPEKQREYQRLWMRRRREEFMRGKKCKMCGSSKNLLLTGVHLRSARSHTIFSFSPQKRAQLAKTGSIICLDCRGSSSYTPGVKRFEVKQKIKRFKKYLRDYPKEDILSVAKRLEREESNRR